MNIKYLLFFLLVFLSSLLLFACSKDNEDTDTNGDPSNLDLTVEVIEDGAGSVLVTATAENTVEYEFDMGDFTENSVFSNTSGVADYTYENTGVYLIEVKAFGSSGRFLKKTKQIAIALDNGPVDDEDGYQTPLSYDGYTLIWLDEFSGNSLESGNWTHEIGDGCPNLCGWGNNELEYYREENTSVKEGVLVIEARKETFQNRAYTSSRIKTQQKFSFQYGRVDIRARLPKGQGLWPALWLLGDNISNVGWPKCGEIDIMENRGDLISKVTGAIHWSKNGEHTYLTNAKTISGGDFSKDFYVFSIIWDDQRIRWYINDELFMTEDITSPDQNEFHQNFFLIFNVAVGGNYSGNPSSATSFPQQMEVDYVRVFQKD